MALVERRNRGVCFIGGAGHSGSTLLGMILGSHRDCFYAGEAAKSRYLHNPKKDLRKRVCKLCGPACPVWGDFHPTAEPDLYEQLARRTDTPIVLDSTKNLEWISSHVRTLSSTTATCWFVYLQRDGRAVINSRVRKYPDKDPVAHIERWLGQVAAATGFYEAFEGPKVTVRYEELATDPEGVTRRLCGLLGIDFAPDMLEFYRHEHHPLGGNNGTQYLVARHLGPNPDRPYSRVGDRSAAYYESHESGIRLDLRWRHELRPEMLELFERLAGEVNAPLRWDEEQAP